jgi:hypothetical protein
MKCFSTAQKFAGFQDESLEALVRRKGRSFIFFSERERKPTLGLQGVFGIDPLLHITAHMLKSGFT